MILPPLAPDLVFWNVAIDGMSCTAQRNADDGMSIAVDALGMAYGEPRCLPDDYPHEEVTDAADGWMRRGWRVIDTPDGRKAVRHCHRAYLDKSDPWADWRICAGLGELTAPPKETR